MSGAVVSPYDGALAATRATHQDPADRRTRNHSAGFPVAGLKVTLVDGAYHDDLRPLCNRVYFVLQSWGKRCAISTRSWPIFLPFAARSPPARRFAAMVRRPSPPPAGWRLPRRSFRSGGLTIRPAVR